MKTKQSKKNADKIADESTKMKTKQSKKNADKIVDESTKMKTKQSKKNADKIVDETASDDEIQTAPSDDSISMDSLSDDDGTESESNDNMQMKQEVKEGGGENESDSEDSESDESESESDDSNEDKNEDFDHQWQELRNEAPDTNEITRRIAVCNMDWDRIRALDLFVCFDSFKPADGHINSVKIYPSEFGLKRMEEEKLKGPPELTEEILPDDKEEEEDKKGSKFHREKLRQYQISRLKYYYAVIDCDSPETANTLYEQLNGMEYESSAVRFDLRFIPDDVTFDHEPTSIADKAPNPMEYKPRSFVTTALQQVKVDLTWDETDVKRKEFFQKVFTDPDSVENEIQDYIASASSESEEEEEEDTTDKESNKKLNTQERIAKYRELLLSLEEKEKGDEKYDIEVTWEPALREKTEQKVKEKIKKDSLNPFEELLQKKKECRKLKKKEQKILENKTQDSDDSEEESSGMTTDTKCGNKKLAELALISDSKKEDTFEQNIKKKKKAKSEELEGFVGDMNDPRFSAMYTSSLFNMVPSDQPKKESNFDFKRSKNKKFKSKNYEEHKSSKKARYH